MSRAPDPSALPLQVRRARWWYWIAMVPVANLVAYPVIGLVLVLWFLLQGGLWALLFALSVLLLGGTAFLLHLLLPVAIYRDGQVIDRAGDLVDWDLDRTRVAAVAAVGVVVPLVAPAVAVYWLYRRRERMGIP